MRITETKTTLVEEATSSRLGQVTFLSSAKLSLKNLIIFFILFLSGASRELSFKKEAGQAGLEPATSGFGDRRSSQLELLAYALGCYFILVSLCKVCFLSNLQYFLNSSFPWMFLLFLLVV